MLIALNLHSVGTTSKSLSVDRKQHELLLKYQNLSVQSLGCGNDTRRLALPLDFQQAWVVALQLPELQVQLYTQSK
jgi:hypothetical protein